MTTLPPEYGRIEFDDATRTVNYYDIFGNLMEGYSRPYTLEENALADQRANAAILRAEALAAISTLLTSITNLKLVTDKANSAIGPADTKTVARESRTVARQLVRITRLFLNEVTSIDTGA